MTNITIGSYIHLKNSTYDYLETCGYVSYEPFFSKYRDAGAVAFLQTSKLADRDQGSGTWKIVSVDGKADGEPLLKTDRINLMNCYPNLGYMALYDQVQHESARIISDADSGWKGGSFVFTVREDVLEQRMAVATFNLELSDSDSPSGDTVTAGSQVYITLDNGSMAHALGLKSLNSPTYFPIGNMQTRIRSVGPLRKLNEMLEVEYPPEQTGLGMSGAYWTGTTIDQTWTISLSDYRP